MTSSAASSAASSSTSSAASAGAEASFTARPEARRHVAVTGDRVLVEPPGNNERRTNAGILIPATAKSIDRKGIWGLVIGVGPHVRHVEADDEVLYLPDDAIEVDVKGEAYLIVRERDVHAIASVRPTESVTGLYL